ncbi:processive diacylglycerol beta-glucosyltransferase [Clostridium homopropionicum DSM 5847]|uniref:Processive diacylglycerol beta-glucosyltransferase n=1 Tax=Clostridium homopropionicum DSM 5847 TaxID=1121318 RepID=A0A0L6ZEP1_9CLOT|nr:glycosyltransferase [Clostridium homopropionicum]KOA21445.1 processive diacylglycerol beta-glucosyltransferase [Clostridium homopropionicum DSM 5847]SFG09599.1 processive 1,2-diacylglycerol beta-glucosyltransferase [Clostridium homopropionicum]
MINNILIISSDFTGHGHKSISESLLEKFKENKNVKIHIVDGFSLGGNTLLKVGKAYGPITRKAESLWELIWDISVAKPSLINEIIELKIRNNFLELLNKVKPDLILTIHPNFNGSILNILEKYHIKIPVVTLIADLVSISPLWVDPRDSFIISPTKEAKERCIDFGIPDKNVEILGFPVRSRFYSPNINDIDNKYYNTYKPLNCLIMSGGEGVGNMHRIAETLLDNFNSTVKIVAGRNTSLKIKLQETLAEKYGDRVEIYGFTRNIQDLMQASDIAFTRGSPNVMMEAIACNVPLIITGALPGQEKENPEYAEKYNLGVVCTDVNEIKNIINSLISNNGEKLNKIKSSQKSYSNPYIAENIVNFLLNIDNTKLH